MDDARHAGAHLGLDRHHHALVARGDQRLLQRLASGVRAYEPVQRLGDAVVCPQHLATQCPQRRRGVVGHVAPRVDLLANLTAKLAQFRYARDDVGEQGRFRARAPHGGYGPGVHLEGVGHRQKLRAGQHTADARPRDVIRGIHRQVKVDAANILKQRDRLRRLPL